MNEFFRPVWYCERIEVSYNHCLGYIPWTRDLSGYFKEYAPSQEQDLREYLKIIVIDVLKLYAMKQEKRHVFNVMLQHKHFSTVL